MKILSILFMMLISSVANAQSDVEDISVTLEQVIDEVKIAVVAANEEIKGILPDLSSVVLTLESVYSKSKNGSLKLLIFSFGKDVSKEKSHKIVLTLTPMVKEKVSGLNSEISEQLKRLIIESAKGLSNAESGDLPLSTKEVVIELNFVVQKSSKPGIEFELAPVSASMGGDFSKKLVQNITLTYASTD